MVSVSVGVAPRMCIGKKFHSTALSAAFPTIIHARNRSARFSPDDSHTPSAHAARSALQSVNSGTTSLLVGAPMAKSSLTA